MFDFVVVMFFYLLLFSDVAVRLTTQGHCNLGPKDHWFGLRKRLCCQ